jgi:hypothetical protein
MLARWAAGPYANLVTTLVARSPRASALEPSPAPSVPPSCGGGQVSIDLNDGTDAPGLAGFHHVVNIVAVVTVIACLLAVIGGIFLATSGRFADHRAPVAGRLAILAGLVGAFGVAIAAPAVNFALSTGAASC